MANRSVTLECRVDAIPPPQITWFKHGRLVTNITDGRLYISRGGSALTIKTVTIEDVGRYTCIARNIAGEMEKNFDLEVYSKRQFLSYFLVM